METKQFRIHYRASLPWLIFWIIFFFPIAIVLFFTGAEFITDRSASHLHYEGSKFWLCFWVLFFFPIAFLLFFINGFSIRTIPR